MQMRTYIIQSIKTVKLLQKLEVYLKRLNTMHYHTSSPIHGHTRLVHLLLITMIGLLSVFGLFAIRYNPHGRQRFVFSKAYLAYTLTVFVLFTSIYTRQIHQDYIHSRLDLWDAVKLYSYMHVTVAITNFISQMIMATRVARFMSQVQLFQTLKELELDGRTVKRSVAIALVKGIGFPLMIEIALILQQRRNEPQLSYLWTLYKLFPMVVSNLLNNCYYGAMIIAKGILQVINTRLAKQVQQVRVMQQKELQSRFYRMQSYCTFADDLDFLAGKYSIVCSQATDYMDLMALSIVLSLLCHLLGITVGFFNQYYAIANTFINGKPYDAFNALTNLVFLVISFLEITLLAQLTSDILAETRQTGIELQRIPLDQLDVRYLQAVNAFSLRILSTKHKIMPLGLFEINISIVTDGLSAVASILLILIQTDLSQRFKVL